jgi:uncharacterized protein (TIGR04255 family)
MSGPFVPNVPNVPAVVSRAGVCDISDSVDTTGAKDSVALAPNTEVRCLRLSFQDQPLAAGDPLPEFAAPPVVETSLGIQFDGLDSFKSLLASALWNRVKPRFPVLEEHPPLDPQFETFGPSNSELGQPKIQLVQGIIQPRYFFVSANDSELVQFQSDRLFFNWRRRPGAERYPRHTYIRGELQKLLNTLVEWAADEGLGEIAPTQCEALYVNRIPLTDTDGENCGLSFIFPWLSGLMGTTETGLFRFTRQLNCDQGNPVARLYSTLQYGTDASGKREAQLMLHVRGRPLHTTIADCLEMIDAEREVIVRTFAEITSKAAHAIWERQR